MYKKILEKIFGKLGYYKGSENNWGKKVIDPKYK